MKKRRNPVNVLVGQRLRRIREERGLSQVAAAKQLRLLRTSLVNIEYGRQNVHIAMLVKFSEVYGVKVGALVDPGK